MINVSKIKLLGLSLVLLSMLPLQLSAAVIFFADNNGVVGAYDDETLSLTAIGDVSAQFPVSQNIGIAYDAVNSRILILDRNRPMVFAMDPSTGTATELFNPGIPFQGGAVKNGVLYGINESTQLMVAFDLATFASIPLAAAENVNHSHAMGVDVATGQLYIGGDRLLEMNDDGTIGGEVFPIEYIDGDIDPYLGGFLYVDYAANVNWYDSLGVSTEFLSDAQVDSVGVTGSVSGVVVAGEAVAPEARAGFTVTKTFSDGLIADVEVSISCNDGFVNADSAIISSDGGSFRFVVTDFINGSMDCEITEAETEGYASDSCTFTNVVGGEYTCALSNIAEPATIGVTKVWNFAGAGGEPVDTTAQIRLTADEGVLVDGDSEDCAEGAVDSECVILTFNGDSPTDTDEDSPTFGELIPQTVEVNSVDGGVTVYLAEINTNSAVETSNDCDGIIEDIEPGDSATCGFTNTVFFEGIPTLSQYGLALMALLMLGVGMVGFRRFA